MLSKNVTEHIGKDRRRSRMEITAEILNIAKGGARKTRIVYGANINFKLLEKYLKRLEKTGLVAKDPERKYIIKTTQKGIECLNQYENFKSLGIL